MVYVKMYLLAGIVVLSGGSGCSVYLVLPPLVVSLVPMVDGVHALVLTVLAVGIATYLLTVHVITTMDVTTMLRVTMRGVPCYVLLWM